jgi:hypothetical protein
MQMGRIGERQHHSYSSLRQFFNNPRKVFVILGRKEISRVPIETNFILRAARIRWVKEHKIPVFC